MGRLGLFRPIRQRLKRVETDESAYTARERQRVDDHALPGASNELALLGFDEDERRQQIAQGTGATPLDGAADWAGYVRELFEEMDARKWGLPGLVGHRPCKPEPYADKEAA